MEQSPAIEKIAPALVAAQAAMEGAKKASNNPHFKNRYADLSQVWAAAEDALRANDLAVIQGLGEARDGAMHMDTMLLHSSGQWLKSHASIPMQKVDPQGYGSATTYLRRYSLAAMLGIVQEDDDGNAASRPAPKHDAAPTAVVDRITEAQFKELSSLAEKVGTDNRQFCTFYKISAASELPASKFDHAMAALRKKLPETEAA